MIQESDKRTVVLYFYLLFYQEEIVQELSHLVLSQYKNFLLDHKQVYDLKMLIYFCQSTANNKRKHFKPILEQEISTLVKNVPAAELAYWFELRKVISFEELTTLIWSQYFNFDDSLLAESLSLSVGTIRHRTLHGLRKLGQISPLRQVKSAL